MSCFIRKKCCKNFYYDRALHLSWGKNQQEGNILFENNRHAQMIRKNCWYEEELKKN